MMRKLLFVILIFGMACAEEGEVDPTSLNKWTYFNLGDGLASNRVLTLFEDRNRNIWIGTDKGLNFYKSNSFTKYDLSDGLVSNNIQALAQDDDGNIWVGSLNGINILIDEEWY